MYEDTSPETIYKLIQKVKKGPSTDVVFDVYRMLSKD